MTVVWNDQNSWAFYGCKWSSVKFAIAIKLAFLWTHSPPNNGIIVHKFFFIKRLPLVLYKAPCCCGLAETKNKGVE